MSHWPVTSSESPTARMGVWLFPSLGAAAQSGPRGPAKRNAMLRHACALTLALLCASGLGAEAPAVSLANVYRGDVDLGRYWISEKLDGVRARWDGIALLSRRGNRFNAPGWFVEGFPTRSGGKASRPPSCRRHVKAWRTPASRGWFVGGVV